MIVIKEIDTLKQLSKKYNIEFDYRYGYYIGNAYKNLNDEPLSNFMCIGNHVYELKYFDGCFNPFVVVIGLKSDFWLRRSDYEPAFPYDKTLAHKIDQTKYVRL